jgi:hypothetical protein
MSWYEFSQRAKNIGEAIFWVALVILLAIVPTSWVARWSNEVLHPTPENPIVKAAEVNRQAQQDKMDEQAFQQFSDNCKNIGAYLNYKDINVNKYDRSQWECKKP